MNIRAEVRIQERVSSYEMRDTAKSSLEIELPMDVFDAKAIRRAVDDLLDDVTNRIVDQLRLVDKQNAARREADEFIS